MAYSQSRWAGGEVEVADPFLCHQSPDVFYVRDSVVLSRTS